MYVLMEGVREYRRANPHEDTGVPEERQPAATASPETTDSETVCATGGRTARPRLCNVHAYTREPPG